MSDPVEVPARAPGVRRPRRDAVENRRRLIDAATTVFADRGLDAGVEEVARTAGVGVATLYRRFPTKEALIAELVRTLVEELLAQARQAVDVPGGRGLETHLVATGELLAAQRGCLARIWDGTGAAAARDAYWDVLDRLLADARAAGRVRPDATREDLRLVFWSLRGVLSPVGGDPLPWRRHLGILLAGLRSTEDLLPGG